VRWLPYVLFGLVGFAVMIAVDALVAWRRSDRRTLTDVASRTLWVTDPSFANREPEPAPRT
jgi:hypothetical protein